MASLVPHAGPSALQALGKREKRVVSRSPHGPPCLPIHPWPALTQEQVEDLRGPLAGTEWGH